MNVREQILQFLREPSKFASAAADPEIWMQGLEDFAVPSIHANSDYPLRPAQVDAWRGAALAQASLVLGPPGTGKTHLLSWFILAYVHARKAAGLPCRVFVSAFTRNAIANLLDALATRRDRHWSDGPDIWFFGGAPTAGLAPSIRHQERMDGKNAETAIKLLQENESIVAGGSIWSLYRLLDSGTAPASDGLTAEMFDLVCIDEASQMVLGHGLMALGGLKPGARLLVAGDDRQLPPVRASREIALGERQLGGSLYTFLKSGGVPEFALEETFRLNAPLAVFPERKFYPDQYQSAVAASRLNLIDGWEDGLDEWERVAIDPQWPVCVILHDGPPSATTNTLESEIAVRLAGKLVERMPGARSPSGDLAVEFWTEKFAIVSPHRAQNSAIRQMLPSALRQGAFVETVDRIQGKERDAVLLSYCVADAEFALAEAEFIFAPERLNVAVTRARTKLILLISRRLLDAVPSDQEAMDKAEMLREFVFDCRSAGTLEFATRDGKRWPVNVRVRGFDEEQLLEELSPATRSIPTPEAELTPELERVYEAVRSAALAHPSGNAMLRMVEQILARRNGVLSDVASLHRLGLVSLRQKNGKYGLYWTARPFEAARHVVPSDVATVTSRLEEVISQNRRGRFAPYYDDVRDSFAWPGEEGADLLYPAIEELKAAGSVLLGTHNNKLTLEWIEPEAITEDSDESIEELPDLSDADFAVLNDLERAEEKKINFGIFEGWTSAAGLADETGRRRSDVTAAIGRLAATGWLMLAEDGRVRSRMAELAREVRYVKQRFQREDADKRPYLVRSLKLELRDRDKPNRKAVSLEHVLRDLAAECGDDSHARALGGLGQALAQLWGPNPTIAAFQARSLQEITRAWLGKGSDAIVIAADTGSGKTEAAAIPLIAAAAADTLRGVHGVRAVFTYPRVRLAANQAQRLAGYLAILAKQPGMPTVTLGLQVAQVPTSFAQLYDSDREAGWSSLGENKFTFPFFACPQSDCGGDLLLSVGGGAAGADKLICTRCDWSYAGWVGSKESLRSSPPAFFLPTTDSLHQWLHDKRYGALFGDDPQFAAPRAILADEIHLYSHIHGAQVGYALRRLAARAELNSASHERVVRIGMSATLGDPAEAWRRLIGRDNVGIIRPEPEEKERSARGREYFYFVQPEVESRGQDIAGASTTIQSLMCLAHGMRRRTGSEGGFRSLVFLDSIDKVRRLHSAYGDAEETKHLHRYRTKYFIDETTGSARDGCCKEPHGCDAFRSGECWYFAANDKLQQRAGGQCKPGQILKVADRPIFSGTSGRVEAQIKESDIVFATSSLEVGYDDPDITLVYQHYAPQNLASFIQRKGRGGRGADDRPITAVTLSIYSPRDTWWFRKPHEMIEPTSFDTPMNPNNHFVRRGQVLSAVLDAFARWERRTGRSVNKSEPEATALAAAVELVEAVFGPKPWAEFGNCSSLGDLWHLAIQRAQGRELPSLPSVREAVDWIPNPLFQTINLPQLLVGLNSGEPRREDIALALTTTAPGNATRRFDQVEVYWRPPANGLAPWFAASDYQNGIRVTPFGDDGSEWLKHLPLEAHGLLQGLSEQMFRPREASLECLGKMYGVGWTPEWVATDQPDFEKSTDAGFNPRGIQHDSRGSLRGFPVIKASSDLARTLSIDGLSKYIARAEWFGGDSVGGKATGLAMARVFWGADAEVKLKGPQQDPEVFSQIFAAPGTQQPMLHGYHVQTEGVRIHLNPQEIDAFIAAEIAWLDDNEHVRRWHAGQMLRWHVEAGAQAAGLNAYEARRAAELIVSAAGDPDLRKRLLQVLHFWDPDDFSSLLQATRVNLLSQHPLLSARRVQKVAASLAGDNFRDLIKSAVGATADKKQFQAYLRSALVHSLAVRLRQSFLHVGRGNERQVIMHVRLPAQFGSASDDIITICEAGAFGDGTTRAFVEHLAEAIAHWSDGFISGCPNAEEDRIVRRLIERQDRHSVWRQLDPNIPENLRSIAADLGLNPTTPLPAAAMRILYGTEAIGTERFDLFDIALSLSELEGGLCDRLGREPSSWELTSAAVEAARRDPQSVGGRLLLAYETIEDAEFEDSLGSEARYADQVFRLQSRLCVDGCQACVHQASDMMSDGLAESLTSRRLLQKFLQSGS